MSETQVNPVKKQEVAAGKKKRMEPDDEEGEDTNMKEADADKENKVTAREFFENSGINDKVEQNKAEAAKVKKEAENKANIKVEDDFDEAQGPIAVGGSISGPFPGLDVKTVAVLRTRTRLRYVNQYGPDTCPWFVIGEDQHYDGDIEEDNKAGKIQCISDCLDRVLDRPHRSMDRDQKLGKEAVEGILYGVCDLAIDIQSNPLRVAERVNPRVVKKLEKYPDVKARRAAKDVAKYPTTYLLVQFLKGNVHEQNRFHQRRSWELSSVFRGLYGSKNQIASEETVYEVMKQRAERFMRYYKTKNEEHYNSLIDAAQNDEQVELVGKHVAFARTPSKSPTPFTRQYTSSPAREPSPPTSSIEGKSTSSAITIDDDNDDDDDVALVTKSKPGELRPTTKGRDDESKPAGKAGTGKISRERKLQLAERAYRQNEGIQGPFTSEQQQEFDFYCSLIPQLAAE